MAGLEQLEIHSKSYIVRWVRVEEGHTISWSVQPHKKSINFGIFKHPGTSGTQTLSLDDATNLQTESSNRRASTATGPSRNDQSTCQEQLKAKGFIPIQWYGKCEADKVSMGTYSVPAGQSGMFGLIFDNTFSKQISKNATFVLLTYPSNAPPHATHHLQNAMSAAGTGGNGKNTSPKLGAAASDSVDSLHSHFAIGNTRSRGSSVLGLADSERRFATYHVGVLSKRRRKKGQGYARRFFSLDFASCTLSYYYNRNSSALRGAIPLSLAAIAADERRREISIDSGAEVWHLKAGNAKDFEDWTKALEKASNSARGVETEKPAAAADNLLRVRTTGLQSPISSPAEEREWEQVEALVSRTAGIRDAVRRLSKDTGPGTRHVLQSSGLSNGSSPSTEEPTDYFGSASVPAEKRPFWKRKASSTTPRMVQQAMVSQLAVPSPAATANAVPASSQGRRHSHEEISIHDHCTALLKDLDAVLDDFSTLLTNSKRRRIATPHSAARNSIDSTSTGEFYDAEAGDLDRSQIVLIDRQSGEEDIQTSEAGDEFITDASSLSSDGEGESAVNLNGTAAFFPIRPKTLEPLPVVKAIQRRKTVPVATVMPPSLIGFLRKNVGKDLSTISMPVSANEPTSLCQRVAEQLEYAQLLDIAANTKSANHRLLNVAAFAISQFSINRAKERAIRKPFNPMLGETFELVRTEQEVPGGFRLLVEKVCHRPVRMAIQADSTKWSLSQSPAPTQKFWGKSAELITEGRVRLVLRTADGSDELYSWNVATVFLRNVVVGEKYIEPVGGMTVTNESTGAKAAVEFKQKGMFGGRSEDVQVDIFGSDGSPTGVGLLGTWTQSLKISENGKAGAELWHAGNLVDGAPQRYGFTTFAAGFNEITEIEKGRLPATDSRLRPDQRAAELGNLDEAEALKARLEEQQRVRRQKGEETGDKHRPRWFVRVEGGDDGEEIWKLRGGKEGYWEERAKGHWTGVEDLFAV